MARQRSLFPWWLQAAMVPVVGFSAADVMRHDWLRGSAMVAVALMLTCQAFVLYRERD